jgi:hypothetical protein
MYIYIYIASIGYKHYIYIYILNIIKVYIQYSPQMNKLIPTNIGITYSAYNDGDSAREEGGEETDLPVKNVVAERASWQRRNDFHFFPFFLARGELGGAGREGGREDRRRTGEGRGRS